MYFGMNFTISYRERGLALTYIFIKTPHGTFLAMTPGAPDPISPSDGSHYAHTDLPHNTTELCEVPVLLTCGWRNIFTID